MTNPGPRSVDPQRTVVSNLPRVNPKEVIPKALYRVSEVMTLLSMSRTTIYEQLRSGRLRSVKEGRTRLVPATAIAEYIALLEHEAARGSAA